MSHDVFISYSSKDKPIADAVCAGLEAKGLRCWIAPRDILPGADWGSAIIDAITGSKVMVLIFSGNANSSPQIKREVERAVAKGVKLLPFRVEDVPMSKSLEYFISTPHWLDALSRPVEGHIAKLAETIRVLASRDSTQIAPNPEWAAPSSAAPVPGRAAPWAAGGPAARATGSRLPRLLALAAVAAALYFLVLRRSPPEIVAVNFPGSIPAGSRDAVGTVQFQKGKDEIAQAQFDVVRADDFNPFTVQPRVTGEKNGSFSFGIHSSHAQQVTLKATLVDVAGRRSRPVSFSFEVRKARPDRPFEIDTGPFKFKIPHTR
jgi:hypothetical protein